VEAAGAEEAAVEYAVKTFGLATAGIWNTTWAEGMEATDVYVSEDLACAAVLVKEPEGFSGVIVLASLDHFTILEVIDAHPNQFFGDPVDEVTDLRDEIGDEAFFTLLRTYAAEFADGNATTADFIALAEDISGQDLQEFFDTRLFQAP
jgi:hypothetical protein